MIIGDFNRCLLGVDWKISKDVDNLNDTINKLDLIDNCRIM